jgi:hypothetical protein
MALRRFVSTLTIDVGMAGLLRSGCKQRPARRVKRGVWTIPRFAV